MMEAILNLAWLAVALATFAIWRYRWIPVRARSRSQVSAELIALICALGLLFPSVSLTDDLHPQIVAVDAASGKRAGAQILGSSSAAQRASSQPVAHNFAAVLVSPVLFSLVGVFHPAVFLERLQFPGLASPHGGRSPPSILL